MDQFLTHQHDVDDDDFQRHVDLLMRSPTGCTGFNSLFAVDINHNNNLDLQPCGSLVGPDSATQLNAAGLYDAHSATLKQTAIPSLFLPHPVWHDHNTWMDVWHDGLDAHIPTCESLLSPTTPTITGNTFHVEQLLAEGGAFEHQTDHKECVFKQLASSTLLHEPVVQPAKLQQTLQRSVSEQDHHQQHQQQQYIAHQSAWQDVHLPPGLWLVAPGTCQHAPVVHVVAGPVASPTAAAAGTCHTTNRKNPGRMLQQQAGSECRAQKRHMKQADGASRKAARSGHVASPTISGEAQGASQSSESHARNTINPRMPITPPAPAAAAAAATSRPAGHVRAAAAGSAQAQLDTRSSCAAYGIGTLVWGKVNRFPWWPAVVISPPTQQAAQAPGYNASPTAGVTAQSDSMSSGTVFVRFLGTHDTAWLESSKASPWCVQQAERSSKTKAAAFLAALREGQHYFSTGVLPGAFAQDLPAAIDQRVQKPQQQQQQQPLVSADAQVLPGTTDQQASTAQCQNNSSSNSLAGMAAHSQPYIRSHQSTHVSPRSSNNSSSGRRQYMGQQEEVHEALSSAFAARNRQTYHGLNSLSGAASSPPDAANTADAATRDSQGLTRVAATTRTSACSRRSAHGEGALQSRSGRRLRTR